MVTSVDHVQILRAACEVLLTKNVNNAKEIIRSGYPFSGQPAAKRSYSELQKLRIFVRDGFVDRYTGDHLIYLGLLRLISFVMPDEFPYHRHGKMENCHIAYYELMPSLDHIVPVSRGGRDHADNWITTSMNHNMDKGHWTLEERRLKIMPLGKLSDWDGLIGVFMSLMESDTAFMLEKPLKAYYRLVKVVLAEQSGR